MATPTSGDQVPYYKTSFVRVSFIDHGSDVTQVALCTTAHYLLEFYGSACNLCTHTSNSMLKFYVMFCALSTYPLELNDTTIHTYQPSLSTALTSQPKKTKNLTTSKCPPLTALCNAVWPSSLGRFGSTTWHNQSTAWDKQSTMVDFGQQLSQSTWDNQSITYHNQSTTWHVNQQPVTIKQQPETINQQWLVWANNCHNQSTTWDNQSTTCHNQSTKSYYDTFYFLAIEMFILSVTVCEIITYDLPNIF